MATQQPIETVDEGIDLRSFIDTAIRFKWLVMGLPAAAITFVGLFSFVVSPSYESSVIVALPAARGEAGLGLTPEAYEEFALNDSVIDTVRQNLGLDPNPGHLLGRLDAQLRKDAGLLVVTASTETGEQSFRLAGWWVDAFYEQTLALLVEQLATQRAGVEQASGELLGELAIAEDALDAVDRKASLSLMEFRLSGTEQELVGDEGRLQQLTTNLIPIDEARLIFLQDSLASEQQTLGGVEGQVTLPTGSTGAGVTTNDVTILNPVYLQLSQDLMGTRTRLVTYRVEVDILRQSIPSTKAALDQLRGENVAARTERQRLSRKVQEVSAVYTSARAELDGLIAVAPRLPQLARAAIVREPELPATPVAPRTAQNMTLAGVLGLVLALFVAFFLQWYRSSSVRPGAGT